MKTRSLLIALLLLVGFLLPANAQNSTKICVSTTGSNCIPIDSTFPFPITGSVYSVGSGTTTITGSVYSLGTTVITGSSYNLGTTTITGSSYILGGTVGITAASGAIASGAIAAGAQVDLLTMRGTVAAGTAASNSILTGSVYNTSVISLSNLQQVATQVDKLGGLLTVGSRPFVIKGTINNLQTTYTVAATNLNIGGLITIATGLPSGTIITAAVLRVKVLKTNETTAANKQVWWFDANPTGSTITDNTDITLVAADLAKAIQAPASSAVVSTGATGMSLYLFTGPRMAVDGSGNIYVAMVTLTTNVFAATNVLAYEIDGTY